MKIPSRHLSVCLSFHNPAATHPPSISGDIPHISSWSSQYLLSLATLLTFQVLAPNLSTFSSIWSWSCHHLMSSWCRTYAYSSTLIQDTTLLLRWPTVTECILRFWFKMVPSPVILVMNFHLMFCEGMDSHLFSSCPNKQSHQIVMWPCFVYQGMPERIYNGLLPLEGT